METFKLQFEDNYFQKNDILYLENNKQTMKVLETPHKKWYKQLFQFLTFGLYQAPYQYKCKLIK